MAAPKTPSRADVLRRAGEALIDAADRIDVPSRSIGHRQRLHDDIETAVADARAVVRGTQNRPINPPAFLKVDADGTARAGW